MGEAYANFGKEQHAERQLISDLNTAINENHMQQNRAKAEMDEAILNNDGKAEEVARGKIVELVEALKKLEYRLAVKTRGGATGKIADAAQAVVAEATAEMQGLNKQYNDTVAELDKHRAAFMALVAKVGLIAREGRKLRAQLNEVAAATGITSPVWLPSPGDHINHDKHKGVIYWDSRILETTYKKGRR